LGIHQKIPVAVIYLLGGANLFMIWIISQKFFRGWAGYLPPLIFSLSPWSAYFIYAGSNYIYLLSSLLLSFIGLLLVRSGESRQGIIFFVAGSFFIISSSFILFLIFPIFITMIVYSKFVTFKAIKSAVFAIIVLYLLIFSLGIKNPLAIKNIYSKEFTIFSNIGLINATNNFQGESNKRGFYTISKLTENKYFYFSKHLSLKLFKSIVPSTFFTAEEKILRFSFSPPIFVGFAVPFFYGIFLVFKSKILRNFLLLSLVFIIPSVVAKPLVDLDRLVLFEPVPVFVIGFGLINLIKKSHQNIPRIMLFLCILLVIVQLFVTIFDINQREYSRYTRYFGDKLEIEKI